MARASSFSMTWAILALLRKNQIGTSESNSRVATLAKVADVSGDIGRFRPVGPHTEGRMVGTAPTDFCCLGVAGHQNRPFLAVIEDGYSFVLIQGVQDVGDTTVEILDGGLRG
jgi:hypothetical protein